MRTYNKEFYKTNKNTAKKSADEIMPFVLDRIKPKSIVDFGCGGGGWLAAIRDINSEIELCGLDGNWVKEENRLISGEIFKEADLTSRIDLGKKYDLAISLEVAEHLDEKYADTFIENICRHADIILFSAAIPLMGGTHHVNEQWPSYWIGKFKRKGYKVIDCLRPVFWNNDNINACYKQDMMFFVKEGCYEEMKAVLLKPDDNDHIYDIVHPEKYFEAKAIDKFINRAWLMNHLPENVFLFFKKLYLTFGGKDKVV